MNKPHQNVDKREEKLDTLWIPIQRLHKRMNCEKSFCICEVMSSFLPKEYFFTFFHFFSGKKQKAVVLSHSDADFSKPV